MYSGVHVKTNETTRLRRGREPNVSATELFESIQTVVVYSIDLQLLMRANSCSRSNSTRTARGELEA